MSTIRRDAVLLVLLAVTSLSCAEAPVRSLPLVDEMPPAPAATGPAGDLLSFYPRAPSATPPPELGAYAIECSVPFEVASSGARAYFTLAMRHDRREALFVFTEKRVTHLSEVVAFHSGVPGTSLDWGFAYDRNGDGWADYLAFLDGALPVGTPELLAELPKRPIPEPGADGTRTYAITREEAQLLQAHTRLVFVHYVDDDFDGRTDAFVSALQDPDHWGWIHRRAVVRSSNHSQVVDQDWTFVDDIARREGPIPRGPDGTFVKLEGLSPKATVELSRSQLGLSWAFDAVNAGLRACRIPLGTLPR